MSQRRKQQVESQFYKIKACFDSAVVHTLETKLKEPLEEFGCATDAVRYILIAGGYGKDGTAQSSAHMLEIRNKDTIARRPLPNMNCKRGGCVAHYLGGQQFIVIGGYDGKSELDSAEVWTGEAWMVHSQKMNSPRAGHASTLCGDDLYVFGGMNRTDGESLPSLAKTVRNDDKPSSTEPNGWKPATAQRHRTHGSFVLASVGDKIFHLGGTTRNKRNDGRQVYRYNRATNGWREVSHKMIQRRTYGHAAISIGSFVLVMGGADGFPVCLGNMELGDLEFQGFCMLNTSLNIPRERFGCIMVGTNIYVLGGRSGFQRNDSIEVIKLGESIRHASLPIVPPRTTTSVKFGEIVSPPQEMPSPDSSTLLNIDTTVLNQWVKEAQCRIAIYHGSIQAWKQEKEKSHRSTVNNLQWQITRLKLKIRSLEEQKDGLLPKHKSATRSVLANSANWIASQEAEIAKIQRLIKLASPSSQQTFTTATVSPGTKDEPPNELCCPILLQLMKDPVVAADGHTYERSAIEEHFRKSTFNGRRKPRSPNTGVELANQNLIPNYMARGLCRRWAEEHISLG